MKDIDFLPEWYKSGRRRQINFRTQYIALGGIFAVMMAWNFIATGSISKAEAELSQQRFRQIKAGRISQQFSRIQKQVAELEKKAEFIEEIDSKIRVGNVLAELSFLTNERVVLSKAKFSAERFSEIKGGRVGGGSPLIAAAGFGRNAALALGDVRFKILISGIAADAADVAELVCNLEDSPYFCQVYPLFSRNRKLRSGNASGGQDYQVTEFEISCYVSNYVELTGN